MKKIKRLSLDARTPNRNQYVCDLRCLQIKQSEVPAVLAMPMHKLRAFEFPQLFRKITEGISARCVFEDGVSSQVIIVRNGGNAIQKQIISRKFIG